jgi:diacylglycerol O-acyltransferase
VKRLTGWAALLLYSETPNVHVHTLTIAVVELVDLGGRTFRRRNTA